MKKLVLIVSAALAAVPTSCTPAAQQQQYVEAAARVQRSVDMLKGALAKATGAKVRVMMTGEAKEREFPVPPEQWERLSGILARTEPVPPALESSDEQETAAPRYFAELVLVGEKGTELYGVPLSGERWMPESRARKLAPARSRSSLVPDWCLPDADYEAIKTLPVFSQAKAWAEAE